MSAIARYFAVNNKQVAGYDNTPSKNTNSLEDIGIAIHFESAVKNIPLPFLNKETTLVVYTPAIQKTQAELNYFFQNDFTVLKRAEVLGKVTENTFCLAVAGTHGKTTTSGITFFLNSFGFPIPYRQDTDATTNTSRLPESREEEVLNRKRSISSLMDKSFSM